MADLKDIDIVGKAVKGHREEILRLQDKIRELEKELEIQKDINNEAALRELYDEKMELVKSIERQNTKYKNFLRTLSNLIEVMLDDN